MRSTIALLAFSFVASSASAAPEDEDWKVIGGALGLLQQIVHVAATSSDPDAARKKVDAMLAGENPEANRMAARMMNEALEEVPAEHRGTMMSIAQDLLVVARREQARSGSPTSAAPETALQARKELHAMGLRYWDEQQFLEAVRRGDRIAVDLFLAAGGLESRNLPPAR